MGWTITPTTGGAPIDQEGNAYFPKNETSNPINYTISYSDSDGCQGSVTYTIPSCSPTPTCIISGDGTIDGCSGGTKQYTITQS